METMIEYKSKADNAVTTGNAVLQDAEQTLKTLQGKFICNVLMHCDIIFNIQINQKYEVETEMSVGFRFRPDLP